MRGCLALLVIAAALPALAAGPSPAKQQMVRAEPARIVNGSAFLFLVDQPPTLQSLTATWMEHTVFFSFDQRRRKWVGLAGVGVDTRPGSYPLDIKGLTAKGKVLGIRVSIAVGHISYPSIALRVPEKFTAPDPEVLARVEKEREIKNRIFVIVSPERQWKGEFAEPVASTPSDGFGTQRRFNGVVKSTHQGLDFHAKTGTAVSAIAAGRVLLAREFFYEGGCVVIDHGQGLLSIYMHLSEIKVREEERVARGEQIALSGASGRATGPHLHLGVRWQGVYLDPRTLFRLKPPE